ncbi:MAG: hypothetical protein FJ340_02350 [Sphingomonadales bacterium]|nr:hypothetical protein [Sphingomonadales bacterium]
MLKIFAIGWCILVGAILLNGIIARAGIIGWYEFISLLTQKGSATFRLLRVVDYVWLFLAYPLLLGLSYKAGELLYNAVIDIF